MSVLYRDILYKPKAYNQHLAVYTLGIWGNYFWRGLCQTFYGTYIVEIDRIAPEKQVTKIK